MAQLAYEGDDGPEVAYCIERFAKKIGLNRKMKTMSNKKVWYVTGSSRGMGVNFVKAALAAGHAVVASGPGY